uniref:DUF223 domain-containing protein n=1 Tax=Setaria italica TaxID=4555 RepID=K3YKX0_SETIT
WVEFHEVELEHIFWRWDVSAMVFWKGNIREYGGQEYLRVILVDEQMEAVACGDHHMMFNSVLIEGETYDFLGVYFTPTYVDPIPNMYRLCEYYVVVFLPDTVVKTPQRPIWISECPRAFRKLEDVYRQPVDTFAGDSSIYTHFHLTKYDAWLYMRLRSKIGVTSGGGLTGTWKNFIIIHVNDPHLQRHIWEWRRAAYQFKTLAALHVKISTMQGGVTTTDYSQIIFSPICSDAYDLKDLSKRIRAERKQITMTARALTLDIINK